MLVFSAYPVIFWCCDEILNVAPTWICENSLAYPPPPPSPVWFGFLRKGPLPTFYWTLLNITRHNAQQYSSDTALRRHKPNTDKNLGNIAIEHIWCLFSASLLSYKLENVFNKRGMSLLWTSLEVSFCLLSLLNLSWRLLILNRFLFFGGAGCDPGRKVRKHTFEEHPAKSDDTGDNHLFF